MFPNRLLKYLNLAIAAMLVIAAAAMYWYACRPLPQTSGEVEAPVAREATATRDSLGVPHIAASSIEDAILLQGYVTAQDRLWQMDAIRRAAAGELAEVVGAAALDSDVESRRLRMRRAAEERYAVLPPGDRAILAAYARGVNAFLESHRRRLPLEFTLLGYEPRPWSVVDSLLAGLQMERTLTASWRADLRREALFSAGDAGRVRALFPLQAGGELQPGSNAWVVGGSRTASGRPLLANDMHLEYSLPSPWYMVHLRAPGLNVAGVSLPGVPCVIVGHNERIAWGLTNLGFDVQDLYIEDLDPATGRYTFRGRAEQARAERESIPVKGGATAQLTYWVTRHGPVFISEKGRHLAVRWAATSVASTYHFPFLDINRARAWPEFLAALSRFSGPSQNFLYADLDGNIGYHAAGKLPVRRNYSGDVPVDGPSGAFEWDGFIPFDALPSVYNPPSGIIVSANQNPFPAGYPFTVNGNFAAPDRTRQIRARLESGGAWRPGAMLGIQLDVYSQFDRYLARRLVEAARRRPPLDEPSKAAAAILEGWNGQMEIGQPAPVITSLVFQHLRRAIAARAAPGKELEYRAPVSTVAVERLLREQPPGWFDDYDQLLLRSLRDAIEEGARAQGRNPAKWDYGRYNELRIANPVAGRLPLIGKYFQIGPLPQRGSPTTVKQTTRSLGPSMRMVADLSDWEQSLLNITTGQSGQVLSRHYKDQWDAYYAGSSFPMRFRSPEASAVLRFKPARR